MRRWRPPQPDLFMTSAVPCELPPVQRTMVVKLLKMLLVEMLSDTRSGRDRVDNEGASDDQNHG
jgi:hypothetical protein